MPLTYPTSVSLLNPLANVVPSVIGAASGLLELQVFKNNIAFEISAFGSGKSEIFFPGV